MHSNILGKLLNFIFSNHWTVSLIFGFLHYYSQRCIDYIHSVDCNYDYDYIYLNYIYDYFTL